jgi:hypothetical protein
MDNSLMAIEQKSNKPASTGKIPGRRQAVDDLDGARRDIPRDESIATVSPVRGQPEDHAAEATTQFGYRGRWQVTPY